MSDAYSAGYVVGRILGLLLFLVPVILSLKPLRRRRTNKKCALSLTFFLAGLFITYAAGQLLHGPARHSRMVTVIVGLLVLGFLVTSIVLAILGLAGFKRRHSRRGRKRAITAMVLSGIFLLLACMGGYPGRHRARLLKAAREAGQNGGAAPFLAEDLNFKLKIPAPWVQIKASSLNPASTLSLTRVNPEMCFMVIAERPGVEAEITTEQLAEFGKARLKQTATQYSLLSEKPLTLDGVEGVRVESAVELHGFAINYVQWFAAYHGYSYQFVIWGDSHHTDGPSLAKEAATLFQGFELLHPGLEAHAKGLSEARDYRSPHCGYRVKVEGSQWTRPLRNLSQRFPSAEFGVTSADGNRLLIVSPLPLGDCDPALDILTKAMLTRFGVDFPGGDLLDLKKTSHGPLTGYSFGFDRPADGLRYRVEILKGHGFAYMLVAIGGKGDSLDAELREALTRVEFESAPLQPKAGDFSAREREVYSNFFNEMGLAFVKNEQFALAAGYFRKAWELDSAKPVYLQNAVDSMSRSGDVRGGLKYLQANMREAGDTPGLQGRLARLQQQTGDVEGALASYGKAFAGDYYDDAVFEDYLGLLCLRQKWDEAQKGIEAALRNHDSIALRLMQASVYRQQKKYDSALGLLREQQEKYPAESQLGIGIAQTLFAAERYAEAAKECGKLLADHHASGSVYYLKARCEFALKQFREAKNSSEAALKQEPANTDIKAFLDHVSGMLGEGSNSALKEPIEPVIIPAKIRQARPEAASASYLNGYSAYFKEYSKGIAFRKGVEFKTTEYRVVKVLDDAGVAKFNTFEIPFDPLSEEIFVNELTVRDGNGKLVSKGKVDDYHVVDDSGSGQVSQAKLVHIPVPGLRPGCEITLTVTRRDLGSPRKFRFVEHIFSKSFPVVRSLLYLAADPGAFKAVKTDGIAEHKAKGGAFWVADCPPVYRYEPLQPSAELFLPSLALNEPGASWKETGRKYLKSIADKLRIDDATRELAKEKTANLSTVDEKVAALAGFVQENFTYKAIEFGRHACIPNSAQVTLKNRYGDCKDHALILRQLLEAAGISARLALVRVGGKLWKELPSLDQFDHMIVFVPSLHDGAFIDATDKSSDLAHVIPAGLAEKETLLLDEANPRLLPIPGYPAGSTRVELHRAVEVIGQSDFSVREQVSMGGALGASYRNYLRNISQVNRKNALQQILTHGASSLQISGLSIEHLEDPGAPLLLNVSYRVKGKLHRVGDQLTGELPAPWERLYLTQEQVENRQTPFRIPYPTTIQSSIAFQVPPGFHCAVAKPLQMETAFGRCVLTSKSSPTAIQIECEVHSQAGNFSKGQYASYCDTFGRILGALEQDVLLSKKE